MNWTVTKQRPTSKTGAGMSVQTGYDVTVTTDTGHEDVVFVPDSQFTPEGVTKAVNAQLAKVAAIDGLTGTV